VKELQFDQILQVHRARGHDTENYWTFKNRPEGMFKSG